MSYLLIDPSEKLDYSCDWSDFLDEGGSPSDTISSSSWAIAGGGSPAPTLSGEDTTNNVTTVFVEGCELGQIYRLANRVVTGQGRTAERSHILRCEER